MFTQFTQTVYNLAAKIPFDKLVLCTWGSYVVIFLITLVVSVKSARARATSKRPFLCLTNAYAAVTLALFLMKTELTQSVFAAVIFWVAGYLCYGILCALPQKKAVHIYQPSAVNIVPAANAEPPKPRADVPVAKNNVRLDHAVQVTDKLLSKNLGKSDRQELEKLKNTLAVMQIKGTLSTAESDILNENFNTLLKLMAKYNV